MQKPLSKLPLDKEISDALPLCFREILTKDILPQPEENKLMFYSKKYGKNSMGALPSGKPISKIITLK